MFNIQQFKDALNIYCANGTTQNSKRISIGLLNEKSMHAVLKDSVNPDRTKQEIKINKKVADVFDGKEITEIQTRSLYSLQKKLDVFLKLYPVNIVLPIIRNKWIYWINSDTGIIEPPRKSPKSGNYNFALAELSGITPYLDNKNLSVVLVLLDVQEYRIRDGYGKNNSKKATHLDLVPICVAGVKKLNLPSDLAFLMPNGLPLQFTLAQFVKCAGFSPRAAWRAMQMLKQHNIIKLCGKKGRADLWQLTVMEK